MRLLKGLLWMLLLAAFAAAAVETKIAISDPILKAKSVFVQDDAPACSKCAEQLIGDLKAWGRYEIVKDWRKADLVLIVSSPVNEQIRSANVTAGTSTASGDAPSATYSVV